MKHISKLKIKTKEGFEIRNLERFPSMEWGENGGLAADLYLNGVYIGHLMQVGNGGPAVFSWSGSTDKYSPLEVKEKVHEFLLRNDKDYGPNSKYTFMRNKSPKTIDDDDFETMINIIEEQEDTRKELDKCFKKGYKTVALVNQGYQFSYLCFPQQVTDNAVLSYLKNKKISYEDIKTYHSLHELVLVL